MRNLAVPRHTRIKPCDLAYHEPAENAVVSCSTHTPYMYQRVAWPITRVGCRHMHSFYELPSQTLRERIPWLMYHVGALLRDHTMPFRSSLHSVVVTPGYDSGTADDSTEKVGLFYQPNFEQRTAFRSFT
jgi:hypothetical protein